MKLEELTLEGIVAGQTIQLGRFSPSLTFVYGENGSGKSAAVEMFRRTLTGRYPNGRPDQGSLIVRRNNQRVRLSRNESLPSQMQVELLSEDNTVLSRSAETYHQLTASNVSDSLFDSVFALSFRETLSNATRFARVLHTELGIGIGPEHAGDRSHLEAEKRAFESLRAQIAELELKLSRLKEQRLEAFTQKEAEASHLQAELGRLDSEIASLRQLIGQHNPAVLHSELATVNAEIESLRLRIETARPETVYQNSEPTLDFLNTLYQRLDEIDSQIRRWRQLHSDIQNQRIRLRDEMLVWNELTLESDQHPYHLAREILVGLEAKVDQAERNSQHWVAAGGARVDTDQMARSLGELCQSMRDDVYQLCNELSHQYKHLRHKSAAAELKQLRRCYNEMGENIERLVRKRAAVIREIRGLDPAGADAIIRAETEFCQCAHHEGYLAARRRFVGHTPEAAKPIQVEPDLTQERTRLGQLEIRRTEILNQLSHLDAEVAERNARLAELNRNRDEILHRLQLESTHLIVTLDREIEQTQSQINQLIARQPQAIPAIITDPILEIASRNVRDLTGDEWSIVYLSLTPAQEPCIVVRSRLGNLIPMDQMEPDRQDQVYLSLLLATKSVLARQGTECPTLIDDAFTRISGERINPTLELVRAFSDQGHQLILLTQHRYLADRLPGVPVLSVEPISVTQVRPITPSNLPARDAHWTTAGQFDDVLIESAVPRSYPLSKYSRVNTEHSFDPSNNPSTWHAPEVAPPTPQIYSAAPSHTTPANSGYSPVDLNSFGDPASLVPAITESTLLDSSGLFNSTQLREFSDAGLTTIRALLELDAGEERYGLSADLVDRWQAQLWLLLNIPTLRPEDAMVLVACGIQEPAQVATSHPQQLFERIHRFLNTTRGRQTHWSQISIEKDRVHRWIDALERTRSNWQTRGSRSRSGYQSRRNRDTRTRRYAESQGRTGQRRDYDQSRSQNSQGQWQPRPPRMHSQSIRSQNQDRAGSERSEREPREAREPRTARPAVASPRAIKERTPRVSKPRTQRKTGRETKPASRGLKFYLDLGDHIEAAPSIGPKTAERFEKIGVSTVAEFLKQTAESMADKLNYKRLSNDVIRQWQHQARLVCRVPNLRGHDAQLLVACDIIEPEELATMQPAKLLEVIGPFSDTKEGLKIIRNGKKPDLAEITDWITWAADTRSLQAA